jgi:hypothetical protein
VACDLWLLVLVACLWLLVLVASDLGFGFWLVACGWWLVAGGLWLVACCGLLLVVARLACGLSVDCSGLDLACGQWVFRACG